MSLATFKKLNRYAVRHHRYRIFPLLQEVLSNSATLSKENRRAEEGKKRRGERGGEGKRREEEERGREEAGLSQSR